MNEKSSVSKELNDKHIKILESLLKRPENRECADCRSKGPRWASINLGIFICMQCSGIHRSLGVHISKVRSTTLDTWLPEQIFFMQSMGNEKSNGYWEEELPPNFNRSEIGRFIHAKYQEKKWASKNMIQPSEKSISSALLEVGGGTKRHIPKKTRKLSLDEESFFKIAPIDPAPFRPRGGSLDITNKVNASPALTTEYDTSMRKANKVSDIFSTPYAEDKKQNQHPGPPARWTTFECVERTSLVAGTDEILWLKLKTVTS